MSDELKSCPFCGIDLIPSVYIDPATRQEYPEPDNWTHPRIDCLLSEYGFEEDDGKFLVDWNRRDDTRIAEEVAATMERCAGIVEKSCGRPNPRVSKVGHTIDVAIKKAARAIRTCAEQQSAAIEAAKETT